MDNARSVPQMISEQEKKKNKFTCPLCHKTKTYGGWEDAEISWKGQTLHLGCLLEHYEELQIGAKLALENLQRALILSPKYDGDDDCPPEDLLKKIQDCLKGALRAD